MKEISSMKQHQLFNRNFLTLNLRLHLVIIFTFVGIYSVSSQTEKRGIAYGYHSPEDLEALSPEVGWWYNWSETPESTVAAVFQNYGFEFVPMTWNGNYNETELRAFLAEHPETKYILAFNEPNFLEQANMTPSEAAAQWPRLEAIADEFNLEIVGPAVNFCGDCVTENGITYHDPFDYLDDFFEACSGCRVDHIAIHSYMNSVDALKWYIGEFKKYGKPIWLTEFNAWEENPRLNLEQQQNYMIQAVDYLENDPDVFRYSWFIGRWNGIQNYPHIELLGAKGELTVLGEYYKKMPVHNENRVVRLPAVIEAGEYNRMMGVQLEKTQDVDGFVNVGYIDAGDWLEYKIEVPQTGTWNVGFRFASTRSAVLNIYVDDAMLKTQQLPNTGDWQNWETISAELQLNEGVHIIRLQAVTPGFNLNWFSFDLISSGSSKISVNPKFFNVYPNPGNGIFTIETRETLKEVVVVDIFGRKIRSLPYSEKIDLSSLAEGVYFLQLKDFREQTVGNKKVILRK